MKRNKPKVIILSGYGLNCEEETKFAFEYAGGVADIVHINDLIENPKMLSSYQILAFPGGFSYGDDTGSGKAYANKFKNHLSKELEEFLARDTLTIGICNGFQILLEAGLLPGAMLRNRSQNFICKHVWLKTESTQTVFTNTLKAGELLNVPIAHGEGNYYCDDVTLKSLQDGKQIIFTYASAKGEVNDSANPNGSRANIPKLFRT